MTAAADRNPDGKIARGIWKTFRSAIDDGHGQVDAGYLALFWLMVGTTIAIFALLFMAGVAVWMKPENAGTVIQAAGTAIGLCAGGFATTLGAVGLFKWGDSKAQ